MAGFVIKLAVALLILSGIGVAAITQIETADTSGWGTNTVLIFGFVGIIAVLAILVKILQAAGLFSRGDLS